MIEQTEMIITRWDFHVSKMANNTGNLTNTTTMDIMPKRNAIKKGLACRLNCSFVHGEERVLDYVAEHSYVIDFDEHIDRNELLKMFRNSFSDFEEKFEFRKLGTILQNEKLRPMEEMMIDTNAILPLLY